MAIRNVNGRNVYVLEPRPFVGTYSNGQSIATFYSDLRWKVWEEIQKSELQKMKIDQLSAKARADIFEQSQRDIRRAITNLQELKAEALAGGTTANQIARQAERQARLDLDAQKANINRAIRMQGTERVVSGKVDPFTGERLDDITTRTTRTGEVPVAVTPQIGATAATGEPAVTGEPAEATGLDFLDTEIDRLERQLEREQQDYQRGLQSVDYDLLNRSRRAFEQEVGVIGQGGGPFGLAPRPRRTLPRVDQPLAQERIDAFEEAALADRERRQDLVQKRRQLLLRREDALAVEGEMSGALLMSINKELDDVTAQLEQPSLVERALQSEDFTPRRAGELLLRDRPLAQRGGGEPVVPQGRVTAGEATIEEAPVVPPEVRDTYKGEPPVDFELAPAADTVRSPEVLQPLTEEERARFAPPPMGEKPEGVLPEAPVIEPPAPTGGIPTAPAPIDFGTPGREMPAQTLDEAQAIAQPDILRRDDYVPSDSLIQDAIAYYKGMTITRGNEPTITIRNPVRHFGNETELAINYLQDRIRDNAPVLQDVSEEIEGVREEREPEVQEEPRRGIFRRRSTRQRKDAYKMKVVSEGTKLASQPKRLQRIAKTESEPEDRPQHLVIVDRLYDTNKGKADAFKMTYDEISRAFAEKPDERKEAHTYLVAKDILESNIEEPLA
jgi:hypothetical protein